MSNEAKGKFCPLRAIAQAPLVVALAKERTRIIGEESEEVGEEWAVNIVQTAKERLVYGSDCLGSDCAMFIITDNGKRLQQVGRETQSIQTKPPYGACGLVGQGVMVGDSEFIEPDAFPDPAWTGELWKEEEEKTDDSD